MKKTDKEINARSRNMAAIKGKDTKPEIKVRKLLHSMGYRYRLHRKELPGSPDIVLSKYKAVIFIHGCFWHRHNGCKFATTPKTRQGFWQCKFEKNIERDKKNQIDLEKLKWKYLIIWECELEQIENVKVQLGNFLKS